MYLLVPALLSVALAAAADARTARRQSPPGDKLSMEVRYHGNLLRWHSNQASGNAKSAEDAHAEPSSLLQGVLQPSLKAHKQDEPILISVSGETSPAMPAAATSPTTNSSNSSDKEDIGNLRISENPNCVRWLMKGTAALILKTQQYSLQGGAPNDELLQAVKMIAQSKQGEEERWKIQKAWELIDLGDWLYSGSLWTVEDQNRLMSDCFALAAVSLEDNQNLTTTYGERIVQGDMVLAEVEKSTGFFHLGFEEKVETNQTKPTITPTLWTSGLVRYCVDKELTKKSSEAFQAAVQHVVSQIPCVTFLQVQIQDSSACETVPSIIVKSDEDGCWSHVGQVSHQVPHLKNKSQFINLGRGCDSMGMALHQLGHALGLTHTFGPQLDTALEGKPMRVPAGSKLQAERTNLKLTKFEGYSAMAPFFDILSIMSMGSNSLSNNGLTTFAIPFDRRLEAYIGQRTGLSQGDVEQLGRMYKCELRINPQTHCRLLAEKLMNGTGLLKKDQCVNQNYTGIQSVSENKALTLLSCEALRGRCQDSQVKERLYHVCPRMCNLCLPWPSLADQMREEEAARRAALSTTQPATAMMTTTSKTSAAQFASTVPSMTTPFTTAYLTTQLLTTLPLTTLPPTPLPLTTPPPTTLPLTTLPLTTAPFALSPCAAAISTSVPTTAPFTLPPCGAVVSTTIPTTTQTTTIMTTTATTTPTTGTHLNRLCVDATDTGLPMHGGKIATCAELVNYCEDRVFGNKVSLLCPRSCNICTQSASPSQLPTPATSEQPVYPTRISTTAQNPTPAEACKDKAADEAPTFAITVGKLAPCPELKQFCTNTVESTHIQQKCPLTCGRCTGATVTTSSAIYVPASARSGLPGQVGIR